jgi:hypothetical protein
MPMPNWSSWLPEEMPMLEELFLAFRHLQQMSPGFPHHLTVQQEYNRTQACFTTSQCMCATNQATLPLWDSCTLMRYTLHPSKLWCMLLVMLHPWAALHTAKLYAAPYWATLHPPELHRMLFSSSAVPSELNCTLWAMLHPTECACILLRYNPPYCTLFCYAAACWATPSHPTDLCSTLLNYSAPSEQCCTLLSHGAL